jgi:ferrochelatase
MKHAPPFIDEAVGDARAAGVERLVALPLAPHFALMSLGAYERAVRACGDQSLVFIAGFHDHPAFVSAVRGLLRETVPDFRPDRLFFTAHSLPARIVHEGDLYDQRLLESCELVAEGMELPPWDFAYQSASATGEQWLGPDLLTAIQRSGARRVLVCPIGFVADHLEVLYDLDIEAQAFCGERGIELRRTPSFNDRPDFMDAMAALVRDRLGAALPG